MAKTFTYKRRSASKDNHGCMKPCCGNCDLMDIYVTAREAQLFSEGGSKKAFKNDRGDVIGTDADCKKTFCVSTGATVRQDGYCREHIWAKDEWVNPNEEMELC